MTRRVGALLLGVLLVGAAAVAVVWLDREPRPDLQLAPATGFVALNGLRETDGQAREIRGNGSFLLLVTVTNRRDEALALAVPAAERRRLERAGILTEVGFVNTGSTILIPPPESRPSGTIPPRARGAIRHRLTVRNCRKAIGASLQRLPLTVDGRTARVEVTVADEEKGLSDYAVEAGTGNAIEFAGC